jgi:hypothetical protein
MQRASLGNAQTHRCAQIAPSGLPKNPKGEEQPYKEDLNKKHRPEAINHAKNRAKKHTPQP